MFYGMSKEQATTRMQKIIKQFDLAKYLDFLPTMMSLGYQKRVMIARSLMQNTEILILDELTNGLDTHIRFILLDLIKNLKKTGITIIISTHYPH